MPVIIAMLMFASAGTAPPPSDLYELTPLKRSAPQLARADAILRAPRATRPELEATHAELAAWLMTPTRDTHARHVAVWLDGSVLARLGRYEEARDRLASLVGLRSSLADPLRALLANRQGALVSDLEAWLRTGAYAADHHATCRTAAKRLQDKGRAALAGEVLEDTLLEPMPLRRRGRLMRLRAKQLEAAGMNAEAAHLRARVWWRFGDTALAPSPEAQWARDVLRADGGKRVARLRRRLKRVAAGGLDRDLRSILGAVLRGHAKKHRPAAYALVSKVAPRLYGGVHSVYAHFAMAVVSRGVNRDLEAVESYRRVYTETADHPAADEARRQAAWLLTRRGLPTDALALYTQLAAGKRWGAPNREGLWHSGLTAFTAGDYPLAIERMETLSRRYGGTREGYGLHWGPRADYWRARSLQRAGRHAEASRGFARLEQSFPISWYGMLARKQLAAMATAGTIARFIEVGPRVAVAGRFQSSKRRGRLSIVQRPELDLALAHYRMGDTVRARSALERLKRARQLYGTGRLLLAELLRVDGKEAAAKHVLRGRGSWSGPLRRAHRKALKESYPLLLSRRIRRLARANRYAPGLLAGLVHVESRFNPGAKSSAGAVGLTQLMYRTARSVGKHLLRMRIKRRDLYKPNLNLRLGSRFLRELYEHFGRNTALAAAAYNAGHGAVRGWLKRRGHLPTDLWVELIPYGQTRGYVRRVVTMSEMFRRLYRLPGGAVDVPLRLPLTLGPFFEERER